MATQKTSKKDSLRAFIIMLMLIIFYGSIVFADYLRDQFGSGLLMVPVWLIVIITPQLIGSYFYMKIGN